MKGLNGDNDTGSDMDPKAASCGAKLCSDLNLQPSWDKAVSTILRADIHLTWSSSCHWKVKEDEMFLMSVAIKFLQFFQKFHNTGNTSEALHN